MYKHEFHSTILRKGGAVVRDSGPERCSIIPDPQHLRTGHSISCSLRSTRGVIGIEGPYPDVSRNQEIKFPDAKNPDVSTVYRLISTP